MLQRQTLFIVLVLSMLLALPTSTAFADQVFFGEDLGQGESVRLPSHPNSDVAHNDFLSNLVGVGTENFESFASGTAAPLALTFPGAGTATLNGDGFIARVTTGTNGVGRYPISGNQYWDSSNVFSIDFSTPIEAFGFYGVDIGDFGGQVTLTLTFVDATTLTYTINNTINGLGGSVLYYGLITSKEFTHIVFGDTAPGVDFFAFDDMTIGTKQQVQPVVPEPATLSLLGTGLLGLLGAYRRRRKTRL